MSIVKDGFYKNLGVLTNSFVLLASGDHMQFGNNFNNIPFSNNALNVGLNADKLDGFHADELLTYFETNGISSVGNTLTLNEIYLTVGGTTYYTNQNSTNIINSLSISKLTSDATNNLTIGITINGVDSSDASISNLYVNAANKLETARTITIGATGRLFDGTANISWTIQNIFGSSAIGSLTNPIYYDGSVFASCSYDLNATINSGIANRIAWYNGANSITYGTVTTDGAYLGSISYLSVNTAHQTSYRAYINGNSMFIGIINIDSDTTGAVTHINFNRAKFNYINVPTDGTLAISVNGASGAKTKLAIDATTVYPGHNNNSINLGSTSYRWKALFIGTADSYGSTTKPIYWNAGVPTASNATVGSSVIPIYMTGGTLTATDATVGSGIIPMFLNSGTLTASNSTVGSGIKPIYMASGTLTASSSTVGSGTKPIYLNAGTLTVSGSTVGATNKPIFLSSGTLTASTSTIGSGVIPIYMSSGTLSASGSTVGAANNPIYLNGGTITKCAYNLNATVNSGVANTIAWYNTATNISSGTVTTDGAYLGSISYLSVNTAHQTSYRAYINGTSYLNGATYHNGHVYMQGEYTFFGYMPRKQASGGGWAYSAFAIRDLAGTDFAHFGVYGSANTLTYIFIGANSYNSNANLRIDTDGYTTAFGYKKISSNDNFALTGGGGHWAIHTGRNNEANKLVRTDGSGYLQTYYINTNVGTEDSLAWTRVYFEYNNDGYIRKATVGRARTVFADGLYWANIKVSTGSSTTTSPTFNHVYLNGYLYMVDSSGTMRSTIDRTGSSPIFGYGQGQAGYHVYYTGRTVSINAGTAWSSTTNGIYINASNLIGIGCNDPGYKLDVNGGIRIRSGAQLLTATTSKGSSDIYNGGVQLREATYSTTSTTDNMYDAPGITFHWGGRWVHKLNMHSNALYWDNNLIWHNGNAYWANLQVQTSASNTTVPSFGAIRMNGTSSAGTNYITGTAGRIFFGGNFHIDSLGSNATYINHYTSNNVYLVTGGGKVGIGTASPSQKLHVNGGIIQIDANSRYLQLGPQNSSWAHLQSNVNFYFNQSIYVDGNMMPYSNSNRDLGGSSNKWRYFYLNNRAYLDEWIQFSGYTGLYWPNGNGAHIHANNNTSYGSLTIRGSRNGYSGIQFGTATTFMTVMDNGNDKGFYQQSNGVWFVYYNRSNNRLGLLTSSLTGYSVTCQGDFYCRAGWLRTDGTRGWYNESYGGGWFMQDTTWVRTYNSKGVVATCYYASNWASATYLLRSDGGAAAFNWSGQSGQPTWIWGGNSQHVYYVYNPSNFRVSYATSCGNADTVDGYHGSAFSRISINNTGGTYYPCGASSYSVGAPVHTLYAWSGFYCNSGGVYHGSDISLKYDVKDVLYKDIIDLFNTNNGFIRYYKWKATGLGSYGVIAQEIQKFCPEAVEYNKDDNLLHVNYNVALSKIIGVMFKKIKLQDDIITELKKEIFILKQKMEA